MAMGFLAFASRPGMHLHHPIYGALCPHHICLFSVFVLGERAANAARGAKRLVYYTIIMIKCTE